MHCTTPPIQPPVQPGDVLELEIHTLTNLGYGLGRYQNWVIMVPYTLPGESATVQIEKNYAQYSWAQLIHIQKASPQRIVPRCPLFGKCGGCQYQHLEYSAQLKWKAQHVAEVFERIAKIKHPVNPTIPSPQEYFYRAKITPHFKKFKTNKPFNIGFLKENSRFEIIDVPQCPIATEAINQALPAARERLLAIQSTFKKDSTLLLRATDEGVTENFNQVVSSTVDGLKFYYISGDFFQNNLFILPHLLQYVVDTAKDNRPKYLIDVYCGVGLFAIAANKHFSQCIGIEVSEKAIKLANRNKEINQAHNCTFHLGKAESIFQSISHHSNIKASETVTILDPPRKGCDAEFLKQLVDFGPAKIIYVSCDPATQARDVQYLLANNYKLTALQPFDLFPQTRHIENIAILEKTIEEQP